MKRKYQKKSRKSYVKKRRYKKKMTTVMTLTGATPSFPFPPKLRTKFRMNVSIAHNPASAQATAGNAEDAFFKLNSFNLMGPATNYPLGTASAFLNNTTAGLYNLLSKDNNAGLAVAPYGRYYIFASSIRIEAYTIGGANKPVQVVIIPKAINSQDLAFDTQTTIPTSTLAEQPFARSYTVPSNLTDNAKIFTHRISVNKLAGGKNIDQDDDSFTGVASVDPLDLCLWQVRYANLDGTNSARSLSVKYTIDYDAILFDLNTINSLVPPP